MGERDDWKVVSRRLAEHGADAGEGGEEGIDVGLGVVEGEGGTDGAGDAEAIHERLGTVVTRADGDAEVVEERAHVAGVSALEVEGDERGGRTIDGKARQRAEAIEGTMHKSGLVSANGVHTQSSDIVEGTSRGDGADVVGRTRLELIGQLIEGGASEADTGYHLATALIGRHLLQPALLTVEHAHARRTIDLMGAEGVEVAVELLHIDGHVRSRLSSVDGHRHAVSVGHTDDVGHGIDRAEDIAHMSHGDEARALTEQRAESVKVELALVGDGDDTDDNAASLRQQLPGDDVAVVERLLKIT